MDRVINRTEIVLPLTRTKLILHEGDCGFVKRLKQDFDPVVLVKISGFSKGYNVSQVLQTLRGPFLSHFPRIIKEVSLDLSKLFSRIS